MAKVIKQYMNRSGLVYETDEDVYMISYIPHWELNPKEYESGGFNLTSKKGIDHYANGLLHTTFEQAFKAMKSSIKNEDQ